MQKHLFSGAALISPGDTLGSDNGALPSKPTQVPFFGLRLLSPFSSLR